MRLDEYQKWLDAQFLDTDSVTPKPEPGTDTAIAVADPPPDFLPEVGSEPRTSMLFESTAVVEQIFVQPEEEYVPTLPPLPESARVPIFVTRDNSLDDDTDVPSIENYLPFLKSQQKEEPMVVTEDASAGIPAVEAEAGLDFGDQSDALPVAEFTIDSETFAVVDSQHDTESPDKDALSMSAVGTDAGPSPTPPATAQLPSSKTGSGLRRIRRARGTRTGRAGEEIEVTAESLWTLVPKHIQVLVAMGSDEVTQNSYKRAFKETRIDLINHLLDPTLSLEDTARLLNVCPTTVRRYTNRGLLTHQRTKGDQRRFKLSDVLAFLEAQTGKE